jgi:hypothetical protein
MDFTAPSFSLGIDLDDDGLPPAAANNRREQSRGYVVPVPPSFSLGFDFDDDDGEEHQLPAGGREAEQARVYAAPDPPSFSLGIGLDDDEEEFLLGGKQAQPQVAPRASSSTGIEEEDDDITLDGDKPPSPPLEPNRFKRLRKGPPPPHPAPTPQMRRYEAPDAPFFDLGIEDYEFLPSDQHHEQSTPQAEPRIPPSACVEEEDDDFFLVGDRRSQQSYFPFRYSPRWPSP